MDAGQAVLNDLPVPSGGRVLIVGGTAANSAYFLPIVLNAAPGRVDLLGVRAAHADHFRSQLPDCTFIESDSRLELDAYDLIVLDPPLSQLAAILTQMLQHKWSHMLKTGGCIITYGLNTRAVTDAKIPQDLRNLFAAGSGWFAPSQESGALLPWYKYLKRVSRNPVGGNLSWEALCFVASQARQALTASLAPGARVWGDLTGRLSFVDSAAGQGAYLLAHDVLMSLFNGRDIRGYRAAVALLGEKLPAALFAHHKLNISRYAGEVLARDAWADFRSVDTTAIAWLGSAFNHLLLDQALKQRDTVAICEVLEQGLGGQWGSLGDASVIGIARLFLDEGDTQAAVDSLQAALQKKPEWHYLKFVDPLRRLADAGRRVADMPELPADWREVAHALHAALVRSDASLPLPLLAALNALISLGNDLGAQVGRVQDCIDVRSRPSQGEIILGWIENALAANRAALLLRLGDGEAYAYSGEGTDDRGALADADNERREWIWWGEAPSPDVRAAIKAGVRECVAQADIIGLPSVYRLLRDLDADPRRFGESASQRGLSLVIHQGSRAASASIVTEERCHQVLFGLGNLRRLARGAQSVVWVTSWPPDRVRLDAGVPEHVVHVPPGVQIEDHADASDRPFWRHYEAKLDELSALAKPGVLVLVAGGIIGKLFLSRAKASGAVALDIGSMADYIAGYRTRSAYDL